MCHQSLYYHRMCPHINSCTLCTLTAVPSGTDALTRRKIEAQLRIPSSPNCFSMVDSDPPPPTPTPPLPPPPPLPSPPPLPPPPLLTTPPSRPPPMDCLPANDDDDDDDDDPPGSGAFIDTPPAVVVVFTVRDSPYSSFIQIPEGGGRDMNQGCEREGEGEDVC